MKKFLILSGVATLILLAAPDLITIGLFMLIVPGVLMALVPTTFGYTALFAWIRSRLSLEPGWGRNLAAMVLALGVGSLVATPWSLLEREAFRREAGVPQIVPPDRVALSGEVLLLRDRVVTTKGADEKWNPACDALCAAFLDTPGVKSVTLAQLDGKTAPLRYALRPKGEATATTLTILRPEEILDHTRPGPPPFSKGDPMEYARLREGERKAVAARWVLRLAGSESLVALEPVAKPDTTVVVRSSRPEGRGHIAVSEVEVRQGETTALRYRRVKGRALLVPLVLVPYGTSDLHSYWEWGHSELREEPEAYDEDQVRVLFTYTSLAVPDLSADAAAPLAAEMAKQIARALADSSRPAGDDAFTLVPVWLKSREWTALSAEDLGLIKGLIVDRRVASLFDLYDGAAAKVSPELREAIAARLRTPDVPQGVQFRLDQLVANMPAGTYAQLLPDEQAIVADAALRGNAPALVMRLSDGGAAAVPRLMRILTEEAQHPRRHQRRVLGRLCEAFTRLGVAAASALPLVDELFAKHPSPILNTWADSNDWRVAMVRMGKPIEEVEFPPRQKPEQLAKDRENLARMVERAAKAAGEGG